MKGILLVALAVIWQGLGTAVVGERVRPELSTFTTFTAFFAASVAASGVFAVKRKMNSATYIKLPLRDIISINSVTAGAFGAFYVAATLIPSTAASVIETGLGPFVISLIIYLNTRDNFR